MSCSPSRPAPRPAPGDVLRLLRAARGNTALLRDAVGYRARLLRDRTPLLYRRIVVRAEGDGRVEQVVHAAVDADWRPVAGTEETVAADTLCVGYGFFPSVELLRLARLRASRTTRASAAPSSSATNGCARPSPASPPQATATGVAGSYVATDEGRLAALGALRDLGAIDDGDAARARVRDPRAARAEGGIPPSSRAPAHRRRRHLRARDAETIVCRCEEVTAGELDETVAATTDVNVVKNLTRAGDGPLPGPQLPAPRSPR